MISVLKVEQMQVPLPEYTHFNQNASQALTDSWFTSVPSTRWSKPVTTSTPHFLNNEYSRTMKSVLQEYALSYGIPARNASARLQTCQDSDPFDPFDPFDPIRHNEVHTGKYSRKRRGIALTLGAACRAIVQEAHPDA